MDGQLNNNIEVTCCFCGEGLPLRDAAILIAKPSVNSTEIQNLFCHKAHLVERIDKSIPLHPDFFEDEELWLGGFFYNGIGGLFTKEVATADAAATNGETASTAFGKAMHKAYKAGIEDGVTKFKEFTGVKGVRPDFVDFETKTIYELKPNNNRAIKQGLEQLNKYKALFEKQYGGTWKTVLEHY